MQFKVVSYHAKQQMERKPSYEMSNMYNNIGTAHSSNINLGVIVNHNDHRDVEGGRQIDMSELQQLLGN